MKKVLLILMLIFALPANAMICLDNSDTLEGGASVDAVVDYTVHGLVGTTFTNIAQGQLSDTDPSILYTAGAAISIVSTTYVNTHSSTVTVNLYLDPANAGTPRRMIPKNLSLGIGYSMHFDGAKITVLDASGNVLRVFSDHAARHKAGGADDLLSAPGAIGGTTPAAGAFTTIASTGNHTIANGNIIVSSGYGIDFSATGQAAGMTSELLDNYEEGTWTMGISFGGGTTGITYTRNTGYYTRIGRLVTITINTLLSNKGSSVGNALITGLPFTVIDNDAASTTATIKMNNVSFANQLNTFVLKNTTTIFLCENLENGTNSYIDNVNFANNTEIFINVIYMTD